MSVFRHCKLDLGHGKEKWEQVGGVQEGQREEKARTRTNPGLDTQECWERGLLHWGRVSTLHKPKTGRAGWCQQRLLSADPCTLHLPLLPLGASRGIQPEASREEVISLEPWPPAKGPVERFHSTVNAPLIIRGTHLRWPAFYPLLCSFTKREPPKWTHLPRGTWKNSPKGRNAISYLSLDVLKEWNESILWFWASCFYPIPHFITLLSALKFGLFFNLPFLLLLFWYWTDYGELRVDVS